MIAVLRMGAQETSSTFEIPKISQISNSELPIRP